MIGGRGRCAILEAVPILVVSIVTAGCPTCLPPTGGGPPQVGRPAAIVYVVRHAWHAGIILPRDRIPAGAWPAQRALPPSRWVEVGWGDRAYWTADHPTLRLALAAILFPTPATLRFVTFDRPVAEYARGAPALPLDLSARQLAALARFVAASYAAPDEAPLVERTAAPGEAVEFYAARGRYDLFHTSNRWTAEALRAAGLPVRAAGVTTAAQIMCQAQALTRAAGSAFVRR